MTPAERNKAESLVWKQMHKDYKAVVGGSKSILVLGPSGTTLAPLSGLTDDELKARIKQ